MKAWQPLGLKRDAAQRHLRAALRKLAERVSLPPPPPSGLRQVTVMEGMSVGLFGVPREQARGWLAGSGCGDVYLRPFWSERTGEAVARGNFSLLWLRGQVERGARLWEGLRAEPGVCGCWSRGGTWPSG